jgi:hypothetical protein
MGHSSWVGVVLYEFKICVILLVGDYGIARISGVSGTTAGGTEFEWIFFFCFVYLFLLRGYIAPEIRKWKECAYNLLEGFTFLFVCFLFLPQAFFCVGHVQSGDCRV